MNYGYIASKLDGTEHKFEVKQTMQLPKEYSFMQYLPKVLNQGSESICVPCSCSAIINWRMNLLHGEAKDNKINLHDIYNIRENKGDGMTFKEALHYLRHHGVRTNEGVKTIEEYAMIGSIDALKLALVMNGPCIAALPVYNDGPYFWKKSNTFYGGHAISIVGYNEDGFIIRNSWGERWGLKNGYTLISYNDFHYFFEIWTVL